MRGYLRRICCALVVITALLAAVAGCGRRSTPARGLLVVGSEEHDFGEHRPGEVLTHAFSLVNTTEAPVEIVQFTTSCSSCFSIENARELRVKPIAPGETVAVSVRFTVLGIQDTVSGGAIVGYRLASDPPGEGAPRSLTLHVRASVLPDFRISPSELDFGLIDGLSVQQVSRTIRITPAAEKVQLEKVSTPSGFLTTEIVRTKGRDSSNDSGFDVRVTLNVSRFAQSRPIDGSLIIATDSKRVPSVLVPVRGEYVAPAQVEPSILVLGSDEDGEVKRELKVVSSKPSRIRAVSCAEADRVSIRFDDARVAPVHQLVVTVKPAPDRWLDSYLDVEVNIRADNGESITRKVRVLIHRFSKKGFGHG